jgi:quinol monooxygenase YgiN
MIHVLATIAAHSRKHAEVLDAVKENMPAVHAEHGRIEYQPVIHAPDIGPFQAKIGEDSLMVLKEWESKEALMAYAAAPHMSADCRKVKDLIASRVIHVLSAA